jgi:hypothetical protein
MSISKQRAISIGLIFLTVVILLGSKIGGIAFAQDAPLPSKSISTNIKLEPMHDFTNVKSINKVQVAALEVSLRYLARRKLNLKEYDILIFSENNEAVKLVFRVDFERRFQSATSMSPDLSLIISKQTFEIIDSKECDGICDDFP